MSDEDKKRRIDILLKEYEFYRKEIELSITQSHRLLHMQLLLFGSAGAITAFANSIFSGDVGNPRSAAIVLFIALLFCVLGFEDVAIDLKIILGSKYISRVIVPALGRETGLDTIKYEVFMAENREISRVMPTLHLMANQVLSFLAPPCAATWYLIWFCRIYQPQADGLGIVIVWAFFAGLFVASIMLFRAKLRTIKEYRDLPYTDMIGGYNLVLLKKTETMSVAQDIVNTLSCCGVKQDKIEEVSRDIQRRSVVVRIAGDSREDVIARLNRSGIIAE